MIEKICPNCGVTYFADETRLRHGRQTTCSRKCSYELRGKNKQVSTSLVCDVCGKVFDKKPFQVRAKIVTVCSWECYTQARKAHLVTPKPTTLPGNEYNCEQCGKHVYISASAKGARRFRFCSQECANIWNSGGNHANWKGGNYKGYYGSNWKRQRRRARQRDNYTCQSCGVTELEKGKQHDVHHIIRFADFEIPEKANHLGNLITLCHSCHIKREWQDYPETRAH